MRFYGILLVLSLHTASGFAEPSPESFVDDGTLVVAAIDMTEINQPDGLAPLLKQAVAMFSSGDDDPLARVVNLLEQAGELGVRRAWGFVAVDDLRPTFGPLVVLTFADDGQIDQAGDVFSEALGVSAKRLGEGLLGVGSERTLARYAALSPIDRDDLLGPATEAIDGGASAIAVVSPGEDSRRVIRELWPTLNGSLRDLTGDLVARGVKRLELAVTGGEAPAASLRLVTASDAAAERFEPLIAEAMAKGVEAIKSEIPDSASIVENAARFLQPNREGATLTMSLTAQEAGVSDFLAGVATPLLHKARRDAQRSVKMISAKQLALAFHNFADVSGSESFPANAAIVDEKGKPLLSWRVALLPFLEESALLQEFRLDEPWDSEHNLRVAKRMPEVYANPSHPELVERGLTTWQRPVYPGSDLAVKRDGAELVTNDLLGRRATFAPGDKFQYFTDGTSNTILLAEVAPEHAVFWTRPDDWRVDLDDPLVKLRTESRGGFVCARADGSAHYETFKIDPGLLEKLITKDGGEAIEQ